jgi:hypothetical protein
MNSVQRGKYNAMPLIELRRLRDGINSCIQQLEQGEKREIDIAYEHTGDPERTARVLRVIGDPNSGRWSQVERVFCSAERCPDCPHGDFLYRYRRNRRRGTTSAKYGGTMAFSDETIQHLRRDVRMGEAYEITIYAPSRKGEDQSKNL